MLKRFEWRNGTADSPILLSEDQLERLVEVGNNPAVETVVSGYVAVERGYIKKYIKYSVEQLFPDLHILAEEEADSFGVTFAHNTFYEGSSMEIITTGVPVKYLHFEVTHDISHDAGINEATIMSRVHVDTAAGTIVCDAPQENVGWNDTITIKAYPIYEDSSTENYVTATVLLRAIAITDISLVMDNPLNINSTALITYTAQPANSTKTGHVEYRTFVNNAVAGESDEEDIIGYIINNKYYAPANPVDVRISGLFSLGSWRSGASEDLVIRVTRSAVTTIHINQSTVVAEDMITGDIGINGTPESNVVTWIRANSHRYVGVYHQTTCFLKQLDDHDSTKYADGMDASQNITGVRNGGSITTTSDIDVWMKMPQFYYKIKDNDGYHIDISFAREVPEDEAVEDWLEWNGNNLIGVYKSSTGYNQNYPLRSRSGVKGAVNFSVNSGSQSLLQRSLARTNMSPITYEAHRMMALLFYAYYGQMNSQEVCGYGTRNSLPNGNTTTYYPKVCGLTNYLGMQDTDSTTGNGAEEPDETQLRAGTGEDIRSVNFWGLENWWGDIHEVTDMMAYSTKGTNAYAWTYPVDVIESNGKLTTYNSEDDVPASRKIVILPRRLRSEETDKVVLNQYLSTTANSSIQVCTHEMIFGDYGVFLPKAGDTTLDFSKGYCDRWYLNGAVSPIYVTRSNSNGGSSGADAGVAFLRLNYGAGTSSSRIGSRLTYTPNNIVMIEDNEPLENYL